MRSTARQTRDYNTKERCKMDDNMREFYKVEIDKLIDQAKDVDVLDLVYKILLTGV